MIVAFAILSLSTPVLGIQDTPTGQIKHKAKCLPTIRENVELGIITPAPDSDVVGPNQDPGTSITAGGARVLPPRRTSTVIRDADPTAFTGTEYHCQGETFRQMQQKGIPDEFEKDTTTIIISGTKVNYLKDMLFANLVNCTTINLSNNQIANVEGTPFAGLINLTVLKLNRNQIADFDPGVFRGLTSVITLWLKDNQLTRVYSGMFDDMTSLRQLHLQKNSLLDVPSRIFNMNNISTLHLDNNGLKTVAEDAFHGATHMHNLFMHMNKIRNLDFLVGSSMTRLHVLTLHKNKITAVRDGHFDEYHHLRQLIINNKEVPHQWATHGEKETSPLQCKAIRRRTPKKQKRKQDDDDDEEEEAEADQYAEARSVSEADDDDEAQAAKRKAPKKVIKDQGFSVTCKKCKGSFRLQKGDGVTFCTKNDEL